MVGVLAPVSAAAAAPVAAPVPRAEWRTCDGAAQCASVEVPRDYRAEDEGGPSFEIALIRVRATDRQRRIGSLFLNPGGPGASGVAMVRGLLASGALADGPFAALNRRFDLVGFDPRGVGASRPAVECLTDEEARSQFSLRLPTPAEPFDAAPIIGWAQGWVDRCLARNGGILRYLSTGNAARDLDVLRNAVGDTRLNLLAFSYGTQLGATYASLFPERPRALVLDGAVDVNTWIFRPLQATSEEAAGLERALSRFFACASRSFICAFTDDDPEVAFDHLVDRLDRQPIPGKTGDPRPVTGDTVREATALILYDRSAWALLRTALIDASEGRGALIQELADLYWGIGADGAYDHVFDRLLVISALDQRNPRRLDRYLQTGSDNYALDPHFWWGSYLDLPWGLFPVRPNGVFRGPFTVDPRAPTALVIGTTYDPATPYIWAKRLTATLGNARLLTMVGDGHTAFGGNSPCVDDAVVRYFETVTLPAPGTECRQQIRLLAGARAWRAQLRAAAR